MRNFIIIFLLLLTSINIQSAPLGEYFTYQGELLENSQPANGDYDITVNLYSTQTGGISLGGDFANATSVVNGIFSIELDIGVTPFMGDEVWIELSIRSTITGGAYTDLPRQKITNSPYAIHTQFVGSSGVDSDAIQSGAVTNFKLANNAVTQDKIQSSSVGTLQIIDASITTQKINDAAITSPKIASDAVITSKIAFGAVNGMKIAGNAVESAHIMNGTIAAIDIANSSITEVQLANDSVTQFEIATGAVKSDEILNGTIVAADIDNTSVQQRITGTCPSGSSIRTIVANGTVACEVDDFGWGLFGNAGTIPGTHFIGTTDNQPFIIKVNNKQVLKIEESPTQMTGLDHMNVVLGSAGSSIDQFTGSKLENSIILGGANNAVLTLDASESIENSTVVGGSSNYIKGATGSLIIGGANNTINKLGYRSAIVSGAGNVINASYSFASGFGSAVTHEGGWVWNDYSSSTTVGSFSTTGINQFLIRAEGGFGLGTKAPASPMHIKGQGKTFGTLVDEVVMTVEPKATTEDVAFVINRLDSSKEAAMAFTTNKLPDFDIRNVSGGALDFNSYESGSASFMMRINDSATNRIDFNTNLEPQVAATYDFGSSNFRWKHIYTEDITTRNSITTDSDRRLKNNINGLQYGLADVLNMRPVSYNLKKGNTEQVHLGFIAQEVESIVPEIVSQTTDEKHMRSMRYSEIIPVLVKATQEQQALIDQQQQQIIDLQLMVKSLVNNQNNK